MDTTSLKAFESLGLGLIRYSETGTVVAYNSISKNLLGQDLVNRSLQDSEEPSHLFSVKGLPIAWEDLPGPKAFKTSSLVPPVILTHRFKETDPHNWIKMRASKVGTETWLEVEEVTYAKEELDRSFKNAMWYKMLINTATETLFVLNTTGRFLDVNERACNNLGYSRDELLNMYVHDIQIAHSKEKLLQMFEAFKIGNISVVKGIHKRKDGTTYPVEVRIGAFEWMNEKIIMGMAHNISAQEDALRQLKSNEEKFRSLFEDHSAVKLIIDPEDGKILDANRSACLFYGYSKEEIRSMYIHQINTLSEEEVKIEIQKVLKSNRIHFNFKHRKADGTVVNVEVFSSKVNWDGKIVFHSIVHDVSKTFALQQQLSLLSRAVESSAVSIVITNVEGKITYVNPYFSQVSGYSAEEAVGENPRILKSGAQSKEFYESLWQTISSGQDWTGDLQNRRKDGSTYWEKAIISPIKDESGTITHYVAVKEDVTLMKSYYDTIELQNTTLRQIAWTESHDLRAPLVKIIGLTLLLKEEDFSVLSKEQVLDSILASSHEIDGTIRYIAKRTDSVRLFTSMGGTDE